MNSPAGFGLFIGTGSIPAEPTNSSYGGIAPAMNSPAGFGLFIGTGSIPAEPTIRHEGRNCSSHEQSCWFWFVHWHRFNSGRAHHSTSGADD
jgi:hypothetical protein